MSRTAPTERPLFCACCGRPFHRASRRGPAPLYCSKDCRGQIRVRASVWRRHAAVALPRPDAAGRQDGAERRRA